MSGKRGWVGYACAAGAALACTVIGFAMAPRFDIVNIAMVYLLAVVVVALYFSRGPAILSAVLCVAAFDVLFVPPRGTFTVNDLQYLLTFAIMLGVALVIAGLNASVRKRAAAQAALALEAETERIRSTLLASISHDLRTPLAVMAGASSSLVEKGEGLSPAERVALAKSIYEQSRGMSERVAKVLQLTRLESGALAPERDWAAPGEIVDSALTRLAERLAAHRVVIELPDDLPLVRVDAALVEQALANLLENAARHTPPGTVVRVRAEAGERELVVSVEDSGPGLGAESDADVFAQFRRGARSRGSAGVGLGLAICRAAARLHGGRAWAEQLPGGGAAFRFSLPIEAPPPPPAEAETA